MDDDYPFRLKQCVDSPIMLYAKGNAVNLNAKRIISVVGTRKATDYGKRITETIIEGLSCLDDLLVVSGLAYEIDVVAHKASLKYNVPTIGVLAHGLDRIYPTMHYQISREMQEKGALLSDFTSGTNPDRDNFPKRNRITADIANSYSRDVFAVPSRLGDQNSEGCNNLIRRNQAALVQSAEDICYLMGWDADSQKNDTKQVELFVDLSKDEEELIGILSSKEKVSIDLIAMQAKLSIPKIMQLLLQLELKGLVRALPGNQYTMA